MGSIAEKSVDFFSLSILKFVKEQEVQESENSESGSDDRGSPSASPFLLKLTIQPFWANFLLEWILGSSNA